MTRARSNRMVVAQGAKGDQGNQGNQGHQGNQGLRGYQGNQGITGAVGQGVVSVTEEYAISTSKTTQPTTGWSITQPTWSQGQYIWSRVKVVYKNPTSTVYTGYAVSSEWEAINDIEIGGRNYIKSFTNPDWTLVRATVLSPRELVHIGATGAGAANRSNVAVNIEKGQYTFSGLTKGDLQIVIVLRPVGGIGTQKTYYIDPSEEYKLFEYRFNVVLEEENYKLEVGGNSGIAQGLFFKDFKLEKGNKATDWTPAPEDVQAEIDSAVVKATYWSVKASSPVIYKDAINAATSGTHTPVTISGELRSGTTTTSGGFITVTPNGGTEAGTATASPVTIAPANGDGKTSYTVRLYDTASKTTLLDTQTIPVVFKGNQGLKGDKGDQGSQGYQGNQGNQGAIGDQGDQGNQGYQGVSGSPPENNTVTYAKIGTDLKNSSAISANNVNWNASGIFTKTLSANTTFTFSNLRLNKVITLVLNGNYAVTMPSGVKIISGEYDGSTTNYIQLHCTNTSIPVVWCVISQEAV